MPDQPQRARRSTRSRRPGRLPRAVLGALAALAIVWPGAATLPARAQEAGAAGGAPVAEAQDVPLDTVAAEFQIVDLINALRIGLGLPVLEYDAALTGLARLRSQDMVDRRYFSHDIPGVGFGPRWVLRQLPRARGAGENLGLSDEPNDAFVQALFDAWVASPSHYENLVRPQFNRVGVGVIQAPLWRAASLKVVTQLFAIANGPL